MQQQKRRTLIALAIVVVLGAGVAGSILRPWHSGEAHANTPPPAPSIEVAAVVGQTITEWDEFSGRLEAVERVEIRPRVGGNIVRAYLLPFAVFLLLWGVWAIWRRRNGQRVVGVASAVVAVIVFVWFMVTSTFPRELTGMTPYLATLIVLAFASQRLRMPKADGLVYRKGEAS